MLLKDNDFEKFVDVFPQLEKLLQCGLYQYSFETGEQTWSRGMYDILGVEPYSVTPSFETYAAQVVSEDKDMVTRKVLKARAAREPYTIEFSIVNRKGEFKRVLAESAVRKNGEGVVIEYTGVLKEITESYFFKKSLEQKVVQLDKSNQNLQEFVYVASHDLQEPLRKISTFTGRLASRAGDQLNEEGKSYLARIIKSTQNMQQLLEDLLSFSRLSFKEKKFENVSLTHALEKAMGELEVQIDETRTTVTFGDLPEIEGFSSQISQLFTNLLSNAIKFRKPGHHPFIKVTSTLLDGSRVPQALAPVGAGYHCIRFEDNGIGFEPEFNEKVFMIFQRLNGKSEYAGSGIGLAICKRIAENHNGYIHAEGQPGKGAIFNIYFPATKN